MSADRVKLPADVELEDKLAFGLTARQLLLLGATALITYTLYTLAASALPFAVAAAVCVPVAVPGAVLALGRKDGLPADTLARHALRHLLRPRRRLLAPEGLPTPLPGEPRRTGAAPLELPVRSVYRSGLVELTDGSCCVVLRAASGSFALKSDEEQAALVEAFGRFLNSVSEPVAIYIRSEPLDLTDRASKLDEEASSIRGRALAEAARAHAEFLRELPAGGELRRRELLLLICTRAREIAAARTTLERRAAETTDLLRAAGVELTALDGEQTAALLARARSGRPARRLHPRRSRHRMLNLRRRTTEPADSDSLLGPAALELAHDRVRIGERWSASFAVTGYPREVSRGWLAPLLHAARDADVALQIEAVPPPIAADRLRRQRARLESTRRLEAERGRLPDPTVAATADDAEELASRLARGESKLFRSGLYLSVSGSTREELDERIERLRAICSSLLLHVVPASFRPVEGWLSTLPLGLDRLRLRRAFDTEALAASFPFAAADPQVDPDGILYGLAASGAPVLLDRFARENYNSVLLARSGAGKSYLAKLEALRLLFEGVQVFVIDPEDEYRRLCHSVGGVYLPLAGEDAVALNPLELPARGGRQALAERALFLAELIELLLGQLASEELPALERAVQACYAAAGISDHPSTHGRPAPLLSDLVGALAADGDVGGNLASRLEPYARGAHSSLFARSSSAQPDGQLVCFSLRGLPERLKAPALLLCLDAIWRSLEGPLRKRCVLVDEAWLLMREPAGAKFLYRLAKSSRKRWCGLTAVTQDAGDLLASELGQSVIANAATQVLLRQAPQAIDRIGDAFHLSAGERRYLLSCPTGSGLLLLAHDKGEERVPIKVVASEAEHRLVTSDPAELIELTELEPRRPQRRRRRKRKPQRTERA